METSEQKIVMTAQRIRTCFVESLFRRGTDVRVPRDAASLTGTNVSVRPGLVRSGKNCSTNLNQTILAVGRLAK